VLDRPIVLYREGSQGPAFGAARLARLAAAGESFESVCAAPVAAQVVEPERALVERYRPAAVRFSRLYQTLKQEFRA